MPRHRRCLRPWHGWIQQVRCQPAARVADLLHHAPAAARRRSRQARSKARSHVELIALMAILVWSVAAGLAGSRLLLRTVLFLMMRHLLLGTSASLGRAADGAAFR